MREIQKHELNEETTRAGRAYVPHVDIAESETELRVWADMPGVDETSVEVRLENGTLAIEGRVSPHEYDALAPVYTEYNVGHWQRSFRLSNAVDSDRIKARMAHGVLELILPKAEQARARRVQVTAG